MADNKMGSYHLADNPELYEIARSNNFEFVVTNLGNLLRAGANKTDTNAYINGETAADVFRLSVIMIFSILFLHIIDRRSVHSIITL